MPTNRIVTIPPLKNKVLGVALLRDPSITIPYTLKDGAIAATVPETVTPNGIDEVLVVACEGLPQRRTE
jgi:hypothetical protein